MKHTPPPLITKHRQPAAEIEPLLLSRYSPRAMSGQAISQAELLQLFEAARWAPSAYNSQPWRFVYAHRETPAWSKLFSLMVEFNQTWTSKAAVLVVVISHDIFDHNGQISPTAAYDTGAAWQNLALQATTQGLIAHGMSGFDYDRAKSELNIPDGYSVRAMIAIGKPGATSDLPEQLQAGETPSQRRPISELIGNGVFPG